MKKDEISLALRPLILVFEKLHIPYYIGGSIASSAYGIARATMDIDIVADLNKTHIAPLRNALEDQFYVDDAMIADAIHRKSTFNLIHLRTMIKIDVFVKKENAYDNEALKRKRQDTIEEEDSHQEIYFASPEDIILHKLQWFELGGRVSDRQWTDVLGVLKVQQDALDKMGQTAWGS